jgi:hypothetical protein
VGRHAVQIVWQFGAGWVIEKDEKGWTAKIANVTLVMQLAEALSWTLVSGQSHPVALGWVKGVAAPCLLGSGGIEGEGKFESSFEIR